MSSRRPTAEDQLQRILYILPAAARNDGIAITDLAQELGVPVERVVADLEEATARTYLHPGGTVDPFTILLDDRRVQVIAKHHFNRPVRLNRREALALTLGLRTLAAEADSEARRREIIDFAQRLEATIVAPDMTADGDDAPRNDAGQRAQASGGSSGNAFPHEDGVEYEGFSLALGEDGFRGAVADAVVEGRLCRIWYLKPGDARPETRSIAPYRLIHADGCWYVAAMDVERDGLRFFRMDRILDVTVLGDAAPAEPPAFAEWVANAPYAGAEEVTVTIRYDARVARWMTERTRQPADDDGSVALQHQVSDVRWIVRHVLQYGGAAVVEEPEPVRAWVLAAVQWTAGE
jgi:proteasome accessory factor C